MALPPPDPASLVLVTGASSGIGAEIARELARRGYGLVLVARNADRLRELTDDVAERYRVVARALPADLGADDDRAQVADLVRTEEAVVGLVNAAGFGAVGRVSDVPAEQLDGMVRLNVLALHELTVAALDPLVRRGAGAVLNVSSVAAYQPLPGGATYAASKAFVQSFSEAVHAELAGTGVSLTALSPGFTRTEFDERAGVDAFDRLPALLVSSPRTVAEAGVRAMVHGYRTVVPGLLNQAGALGGRLAPRSALLPAMNHLIDLGRRG